MKKRCLSTIIFMLAAALCIGFIFPISARTNTRTVWTGELPERGGEIQCNLLKKEGVNVCVEGYSDEYRFSVIIDGVFDSNGIWGYLQAESDGNLGVEVGKQEIFFSGKQTEIIDFVLTPLNQNARTATANLTFSCGDTELKGSFSVPLLNYDDYSDREGRISYCPSWYNKYAPINITVDSSAPIEIQCNGDSFPKMTSYTVDGTETILYDGGKIYAGAGAEIKIDLSKTDFSAEYLILTADSQMCNLKRIDLPNENTNGKALTAKNKKITLPTEYEWQGMKANVSVERLDISDKSGNVWKNVDSVTAKESDNNRIELSFGSSEVGTYKVTINRFDGDIQVYSSELTVFVVGE